MQKSGGYLHTVLVNYAPGKCRSMPWKWYIALDALQSTNPSCRHDSKWAESKTRRRTPCFFMMVPERSSNYPHENQHCFGLRQLKRFWFAFRWAQCSLWLSLRSVWIGWWKAMTSWKAFVVRVWLVSNLWCFQCLRAVWKASIHGLNMMLPS